MGSVLGWGETPRRAVNAEHQTWQLIDHSQRAKRGKTVPAGIFGMTAPEFPAPPAEFRRRAACGRRRLVWPGALFAHEIAGGMPLVSTRRGRDSLQCPSAMRSLARALFGSTAHSLK